MSLFLLKTIFNYFKIYFKYNLKCVNIITIGYWKRNALYERIF